MRIFIEKEDKTLDWHKPASKLTAAKLLREFNINPATVILVRNNEVILEDELLESDDNLKILSVISGG